MIGRTFGQYRIVAETGRGNAGTVYRAVDESLLREVAIKILDPAFAHPEIIRRFRTEATTLARLNHPAIATIHELFECDDELLMVMEFVRGETLAALSDRVGRMTPDRAAQLVDRVLWGLDHAHRAGVVHRDVKPANVMVTADGGVKIMDFGIARILGVDQASGEGCLLGTPAYMAPEQVLGHAVDTRADLYAAGIIFYRLLSGTFPFDAGTTLEMLRKRIFDAAVPLRERLPDLPPWCDEVVQRALAKQPEDRFQSADEFRCALARAQGGDIPRDAEWVVTPPPIALFVVRDAPATPAREHTQVLRRPRGARAGGHHAWPAAAAIGFLAVALTPVGEPTLHAPTAPAWPAAAASSRPAPAPPAVRQAEAAKPSMAAAQTPVPGRRLAVIPRRIATPAARLAASSRAPSATASRPIVFATKALVATGTKYQEHDAQLVLGAEKVRVSVSDDGRQRLLHSVPSEKIISISYSRGRHPEWLSPAGPATLARTGGGVMGVFRRDRHWIAMRTKTRDSFVILRVEESSAPGILAALEARTGRKVQLLAPAAPSPRKSG